LRIEFPSFPPVSGADDANGAAATDEPDRQDNLIDPADAKSAFLDLGVFRVSGDHTVFIEKSPGGRAKVNAVSKDVVFFLVPIPDKGAVRTSIRVLYRNMAFLQYCGG